MRKKTIPQIKKKLDILFSKEVRERDSYVCRKCHTRNTRNHCAHIFSRNKLSTRYDIENAITLCYACHIHWAHRQPVEFTRFVEKVIGTNKLKEIEKRSQKIIDDPRPFLENIAKRYEIIL